MNCPDCRGLLNRSLDGETNARALAEAHLHSCPECLALWALADRMVEGSRGRLQAAPPAGFARRVAAVAVRERSSRRRRLVWQRVAAAAALLLAPWLAAYLLLPGTAPRQEVGPVTPIANQKAEPPLGDVMRDMQISMAGLGTRLVDVTQEQAEAAQSAAVPVEVSTLPMHAPAARPQTGVSGLQIVGNRTRRGLAFLAGQ